MIILRMSGGLGNQMFQYAFYTKLCALGRKVTFDDVTEYAAERNAKDTVGNARPVALPIFGIHYPVCTREDLIRLTDADLRLASRVRRKILGRHSMEQHDEDFIFDPSFLERKEGYFTGCFQSPRYFEGAEDEVKRAFTFPGDILEEGRATGCAAIPPLSREAVLRDQAVRETIRTSKRSCALHLRFGDYLDKAGVYGGITTDAYYDAGIRNLLERHPDTRFFVFSNDAARAKAWIADRQAPECFTVVEGNDELHGYADLYLMSLCSDFIIANSSFSWWGAYLGEAKDKIVIAPTFWINDSGGRALQRTDIFPKSWVRVSPSGILLPGTGCQDRELDRAECTDYAGCTEHAGDANDTTHADNADGSHQRDTEQASGTDHSGRTDRETCPDCAGYSAHPLVSVIVAAYNIEGYIARALDSLRAQTLPRCEFIVVDDGSTDDTGRICDDYAARDARFRVIHKENGGLSDARNAGLAIARGDWIGYLDGDDAASPRMFESLYDAAVMADADIALCAYEEVSEQSIGVAREPLPASTTGAPPAPSGEPGDGSEEAEGDTTKAAGGRNRSGAAKCGGGVARQRGAAEADSVIKSATVLSREQALDIYLRSGVADVPGGINFYNSVWSKLFKRELVDGILFPVGRNSEDILYTTKALMRAKRAVYLPDLLYLYTLDRAGSIMNGRVGERRLNDEIPFYEEQIALLEGCGETDLAQKARYYLSRRLLFYWEDFDKETATREYADRIRDLLYGRREEIRGILKDADYGRRGDRKRLSLFLFSEKAYRRFARLYAGVRGH